MKFSPRVTEFTQDKLLPKVVDIVNNSNVFTARVTANPKNWMGEVMKQPIQVANSSTGGPFSGMDTFDTSATDNVRSLKWYVKAHNQTITIPGIEKDVNAVNDTQVISLIGAKMDEAANSLIDSLGTAFYGKGVGDSIEGLGLIVDNGTATSSYGDISRAELPSINASVTAAAGGTLSLALVSAAFDDASAAGDAHESPTIAYTTKAVWSLFETILNSKLTVQYEALRAGGYNKVTNSTPNGVSVPGSALKGAAGFDSIDYRGKQVVADDKAPAGTFFWVNENYLEFRRLLSKQLKQIPSKNQVTEGAYASSPQPSFLQMRDFLSPVNQYGEIGVLIVMGNLIHRNPRRNSKITGITKAA
jgi:hypothetical protein